MKRFTFAQLKRSTGLAAVSPGKASARRQYLRDKAEYLLAHPFCQICIAVHGLDEAYVIATGGRAKEGRATWLVPRAVDVHHRNKRDGDRLLDQRWWMSASRSAHDLVEANKAAARLHGLLLPIQADADGRWGDGNEALPTPAFMLSRVGRPPLGP